MSQPDQHQGTPLFIEAPEPHPKATAFVMVASAIGDFVKPILGCAVLCYIAFLLFT